MIVPSIKRTADLVQEAIRYFDTGVVRHANTTTGRPGRSTSPKKSAVPLAAIRIADGATDETDFQHF